eukprot:4245374-Ditylum_brightwellii.AAC.1
MAVEIWLQIFNTNLFVLPYNMKHSLTCHPPCQMINSFSTKAVIINKYIETCPNCMINSTLKCPSSLYWLGIEGVNARSSSIAWNSCLIN